MIRVSTRRCSSLAVQDAGNRIGGVALRVDALVPIVVGVGRILNLDVLQPVVFPGGLVEMAVNTDVSVHQDSSGVRASRINECGGRVKLKSWSVWSSAGHELPGPRQRASAESTSFSQRPVGQGKTRVAGRSLKFIPRAVFWPSPPNRTHKTFWGSS